MNYFERLPSIISSVDTNERLKPWKLKKRYKVMSLFSKPEIEVSDNADVIHVSIQKKPLIIFDAKYNQTLHGFRVQLHKRLCRTAK
jgi:hypothetical protein